VGTRVLVWLFLLLALAMPAGLNSRGKKREKLNYMHANPVKRGLVKQAGGLGVE
jgi:hypothetical protein